MSKKTNRIKNSIGKIIDRIPRSVTVKVSKVSREDSLAGKTILVIGASRGIGFEIAKTVHENGANVILTGRTEETLKAASDRIGDRCGYVVHDNCDFGRIDMLYETAVSRFGQVDALVYSTGIHLQGHGFTEVTPEEFDKHFDTNLKAAYFIVQKFIKEKKKEKDLNIVIITSESGCFSDYMPYNLTKVALNGFIRGLAKKYYRSGVRVNGVAPGVTATEMMDMKDTSNLNAKDYSPGRYFVPEEMAEVVSFLLSDASACISGEIINCAGGHQVHTW